MGLNLGYAALTILKGEILPRHTHEELIGTSSSGRPLRSDICSITQGNERYFSFCSQAYGLMADVDLGTEHLR